MLNASIKKRALEAGFDLVGIAPIAAWEDLKFSRQWVERGYGGEMRYLENPKRDDPRRVLPSVRSVICVGLVYNADLPYSVEVSRQKAVGRMQNAETENQNYPGYVDLSHSPVNYRDPSSPAAPQDDIARDDGHRTKDTGQARTWVSRYAWGADYHRVMRARLEKLRAAIEDLAPDVETRVYVDTGPIVERAFARLSGIGWMGKNTCLINQHKGSWFFLGVILTSLELPPDLPAPDRCGSCTRCLDACPTGALPEPYVMDASRCIAYFTIELKGSIPSEFRPAIGGNVFGCDICQDVCPWNSCQSSVVSRQLKNNHQPSAIRSQHKAATTDIEEFRPLELALPSVSDARTDSSPAGVAENGPRTTEVVSLFNPRLDSLASLTEDDFRRIFRDSPIKRVKYHGWLRNLCVAMGNSGDPRLLPHLERLRDHIDPTVREHAEWAIEQLAQVELNSR